MRVAWNDSGIGRENHIVLSRGQQLLELMVFLFLVLPSLLLSFLAVEPDHVSFPIVAASNILRDLSLLCLVLYFVWRNGEGFEAIGWNFSGTSKEALVGVGLFVPVYLVTALFGGLLREAGLSAPETLPSYLIPSGVAEYLLALVFLVVVAVSEETIFRGYLMLRLQAITGNPTVTVILSALIFSFGHGYQGAAGVITVALLGVAFALVYLWRGSLVAPFVMHFLQNFIGIILVPLFGVE